MKKIALLFPGQGSQYVGMGEKLYKENFIAKQTFDEANDILGFDLQKLCFEGSIADLSKTENAQPAILTASVAAFRVLMQELNISPTFLAGHSLGEISALTCAGAITFSDALRIVRIRGKVMQEAVAIGRGAMAAIGGIEAHIVEEECRKHYTNEQVVVVSNYNSPEQIVISGHEPVVNKVIESLSVKGATVTPLRVSAPFHSPLMRTAADKFSDELKKYTFNDLKWPVISNVSALPYVGADSILNTLVAQIFRPVKWQKSMEFMIKHGTEVAVDVGPGNVVKNLMKKNSKGIFTFSIDKDDIEQLRKELTIQKSHTEYQHTIVTKCIAIAVCTRNRNWNNDEYQKGVTEPYREIQKIQESIESSDRTPIMEEMEMALEMLRSVFITKKVPIDEQVYRFKQVFDETMTHKLFPNFLSTLK